MTAWRLLDSSTVSGESFGSSPRDAIALNSNQAVFGIADFDLGTFGKLRLFVVTVASDSVSVSSFAFDTPGDYDNAYAQSLARLDDSRFAVAWASDETTPPTHYVTQFLVSEDGTISEGATATTSTTVQPSNFNGSQAMVAIPSYDGIVVIQDADLGAGYYAHFRAAKFDGTSWTLGARSQIPIADPIINIDANLLGVEGGFYFGAGEQHIAATVDPDALSITWGSPVETSWRTDNSFGVRSVNAVSQDGAFIIGADAPTFGDSSTSGAARGTVSGATLSIGDYVQKPASTLRPLVPGSTYGAATFGESVLMFHTFASGLPPDVWSFGWSLQSQVADYSAALLDSEGHMFIALGPGRFVGAVSNHAPTYAAVTFVLIGAPATPPLRQNQRDDIRQNQRTSQQLTVRQRGYL